MMKNAMMVLGAAALMAGSAAADVADYSIGGLKIQSRQPWDEAVEISFTVTPPAGGTTAKAVELDIVASNGVDEVYISDAAISTRMAATSGSQKIYWRPDIDHPNRAYGNLRVYVSVKAEVTTPPPYMLVNLNDGSIGYAGQGVEKAIKLYSFLREVMAFRYIPPTTSDEWKAKSGGDDFFWFGTDERDAAYNYKTDGDIAREDLRHKVKLTKGFYFGVYPATRGHLAMLGIAGFERNSQADNAATGITYEQARGEDTVNGYNMPTSSAVDPASIVGKMRTLTGRAFDLPSNFQWEYAARAGSTNTFLFTESGSPSMDFINDNFRDIRPCVKPANAWGIYGIIGCCHQWTTTLGRTTNAETNNNFYRLSEDATDPTGPTATYDHPYRICRGSHHNATSSTTTRDKKTADIRYRVYRIAYKYPMRTDKPAEVQYCGIRLCLPVDD